jgi:glutathione synthase
LRNHPEKLAIMEFPQFIGPTLVTRSADAIKAFPCRTQRHHLETAWMAWAAWASSAWAADGMNLGSIIETLNLDGAQSVMVQKFLPAIAQGDKRVLDHWRQACALLLGPHSARRRSARQLGGRRQGCGTAH